MASLEVHSILEQFVDESSKTIVEAIFAANTKDKKDEAKIGCGLINPCEFPEGETIYLGSNAVLVAESKFCVYLEVRIFSHWEEDGKPVDTRSTIRFDYHNLRALVAESLDAKATEQVNRANPKAVGDKAQAEALIVEKANILEAIFPHLDDLKVETLAATEKLQLITITTRQTPLTCNVFSHNDYGHPDFHRGLQNAVRNKSTTYSLLLKSTDAFKLVSTIESQRRAQAHQDPIREWYPQELKETTNPTFQMGQFRKPEHRPRYTVPAQFSFHHMLEYQTIHGFGIVSEEEYIEKMHTTTIEAGIRFCEISPGEESQYFIFLQLSDEIERWNVGTGLKIDVIGEGKLDEYWYATVIEHIPYANNNDMCALLNRRWLKNEEKFVQAYIPGVVSVKDSDTHQDLADKIHRAEALLCNLVVETSTTTQKRQINAMRRIVDKADMLTTTILLSSRLDMIPDFKLYDEIPADFPMDVMTMSRSYLNGTQLQAIDNMQTLHGGIGIIEGPPGTGKTRFLAATLSVFPFMGQKILAACTTNMAVENLVEKLLEITDKISSSLKLRTVKVIRAYSVNTDSELLMKHADEQRSKPTKGRPPRKTVETPENVLTEMKTAWIVLNAIHKREIAQPHGVRDKRVTLPMASLGFHMLLQSGLFEEDETKQPDEHTAFRLQWQAYIDGMDFKKETKESFTRELNKLRVATLLSADILVTTLSNAGEPKLQSFQPDVIAVDEAGLASEIECLPLFAWYTPRIRLFVGDTRQLRPQVRQHRDHPRPFAQQIPIPLMLRLKAAGFQHATLLTEYRYNPDINDLISSKFYGDRLVAADITKNRTLAKLWKAIWARRCKQGKKLQSIVVDISSDHQQSAFKSLGNPDNVRYVYSIIKGLAKEGIMPSDITVLTPYHGQYVQYLNLQTAILADMQEVEFEDRTLAVAKVDTFQGRESKFIILDLVRSEKLGFLRDGNRLNVAISRALHGMLIVGNFKGIGKGKQYMHSKLQGIINWHIDQKSVIKISQQDIEELPELLIQARTSQLEARSEAKRIKLEETKALTRFNQDCPIRTFSRARSISPAPARIRSSSRPLSETDARPDLEVNFMGASEDTHSDFGDNDSIMKDTTHPADATHPEDARMMSPEASGWGNQDLDNEAENTQMEDQKW